MELELSAAFMANPRSHPLYAGEVRPENVRLYVSELYPTEIFWRQLHHSEFDVSEMSISSLFIAVSRGLREWVAIPVFPMRRFFHTGVMIRTDRGIDEPADLAGKRVGVPEYQQTAALWSRGVLRDEFGVQPASMEWFMERDEQQSHGGATGFTPPPGVRLTYLQRSQAIGRMLRDGELDALIHFSPGNNIIDRSTFDPLASPNVRLLFDRAAEAKRYFAKTGIFPINHTLVVRRSIAERHPWVVTSLFEAFTEAKRRTRVRLQSLAAPFAETGLLGGATLDRDLHPYGIAAARTELETVSRFLHEDGLTASRVALDEVFAPQTLAS